MKNADAIVPRRIDMLLNCAALVAGLISAVILNRLHFAGYLDLQTSMNLFWIIIVLSYAVSFSIRGTSLRSDPKSLARSTKSDLKALSRKIQFLLWLEYAVFQMVVFTLSMAFAGLIIFIIFKGLL